MNFILNYLLGFFWRNEIVRTISGIIFAIFLIFLAGKAAYGLYINRISEDWPSTQARIAESAIEKKRGSWKKRNVFKGHRYCARVTYEYTVDGEIYTLSSLTAGDEFKSLFRTRGTECFRSEENAEEYLSELVEAGPVDVYYDPSNPAIATLHKPSTQEEELPFLSLLLFLVPTVGLFLLGLLFTFGPLKENGSED